RVRRLVRCYNQCSQYAHKRDVHASRRPQGFCRSQLKKVGHLLLRTIQERPIYSRTSQTVSRQQSRLGILPFATSLVPKGDDLLGHQREKRRNETQATFLAHREFPESAIDSPAYAHEEEVT